MSSYRGAFPITFGWVHELLVSCGWINSLAGSNPRNRWGFESPKRCNNWCFYLNDTWYATCCRDQPWILKDAHRLCDKHDAIHRCPVAKTEFANESRIREKPLWALRGHAWALRAPGLSQGYPIITLWSENAQRILASVLSGERRYARGVLKVSREISHYRLRLVNSHSFCRLDV